MLYTSSRVHSIDDGVPRFCRSQGLDRKTILAGTEPYGNFDLLFTASDIYPEAYGAYETIQEMENAKMTGRFI